MINTGPFGRTGHLSSRVIFGAAGLGDANRDIADEIYSMLLHYGINHLDTARGYGAAELLMAPWLAKSRDKFFLASKTLARDYDGAKRDLYESLTRLGTDKIDLLQLHDLVEEDEWETAHGKNGAVQALLQAREEGLIDYIGVTGHGLRIAKMHLKSLERFDFDSVLFPYNPILLKNASYYSDVQNLLEKCRTDKVAIQTIKAIARRRYRDNTSPENHTETRISWYEPLSDSLAIRHAVDFVLSQPDIFLVGPSDWRQLPKVLAAAELFNGSFDQNQINSDIDRLSIEPLFDGKGLEKI
jgi:aryl-alcohol dehydrogenase-like predicted oxidoreductase